MAAKSRSLTPKEQEQTLGCRGMEEHLAKVIHPEGACQVDEGEADRSALSDVMCITEAKMLRKSMFWMRVDSPVASTCSKRERRSRDPWLRRSRFENAAAHRFRRLSCGQNQDGP